VLIDLDHVDLLEDLHPMVLPVCHQDVSVAVDSDPLQPLEFSVVLSPPPEGSEERAVGVEDLDAIVARIGHEDVTLFIDSHTPRELELSFIRSFRSEGG